MKTANDSRSPGADSHTELVTLSTGVVDFRYGATFAVVSRTNHRARAVVLVHDASGDRID